MHIQIVGRFQISQKGSLIEFDWEDRSEAIQFQNQEQAVSIFETLKTEAAVSAFLAQEGLA